MWRRPALGGQKSLLLLKVAFSVWIVVALVGIAIGAAVDISSGEPLTSTPLAVAHGLVVCVAAAVFFTHTRELSDGHVGRRAVSAMVAGTVVVAVLGASASVLLSQHVASPEQAVAKTRPFLAEPWLLEVAAAARGRAAWRPWERWSVAETGWTSRDGSQGSASGSGIGGLPGPEQAHQPSWMRLTVGRQEVCLTRTTRGHVPHRHRRPLVGPHRP